MVEPKCPSCNVTGKEHIVSVDSAEYDGDDPWFQIVHCDQCGHVYGVFAKIIQGPTFQHYAGGL